MNEHVNEVAAVEDAVVATPVRKKRNPELTAGSVVVHADENGKVCAYHLAMTTTISFTDSNPQDPSELCFDWRTASEETKKFYAHQGFAMVTRQYVTKDVRSAKEDKADKETIWEILQKKCEDVRAYLAGDFSSKVKDKKEKAGPKINWDLLVRVCRANGVGKNHEDDKELKNYLKTKMPNGLTAAEVILHPKNTTYAAVREMYESEMRPVDVNNISLDL